MSDGLALEREHGSNNYHPLPIVIAEAEGAWVTDVDGRRYIDCLAGYSAMNFGHRHPEIVASAHAQLDRVTLTSRAFHHDQLGPFCAELAALAGMDMVLPMNTGAEAVESAIKVARLWGYTVKGVPAGRATVVVAANNFHGRTITLVSCSTDPVAHDHFGPYTTGFRIVPYGDGRALEEAIDETTVAVLLEPVQGEAGVVLPPDGYLRTVRDLCTDRDVLFLADEVQSGLGRTGYTFACSHEDVRPDVYILGKALGGGIMPVSAVVADRAVLAVLGPGSTAARSAVTRWPQRSGAPSSGYWAPITTRSDRARSGLAYTTSWIPWSDKAWSRYVPEVCGPASTSTPMSGPDVRCVNVLLLAASWRRTRTDQPCVCPRLWW